MKTSTRYGWTDSNKCHRFNFRFPKRVFLLFRFVSFSFARQNLLVYYFVSKIVLNFDALFPNKSLEKNLVSQTLIFWHFTFLWSKTSILFILLLRSFQPQQTKPKMKLIFCVSTNQNL